MLPGKNESFLPMSIEDLTSIFAKGQCSQGVSLESLSSSSSQEKGFVDKYLFFYTHPISRIFLYVTRVHATDGFGAR